MKKIVYNLLTVLAIISLAGACTKEEISNDGSGSSSTTTLTDPELAWSASSAEATIGSDDNDFPTLTNEYDVSVSYSSSDTDVATISGNGTITLIAAGTTAITASSEATSTYSSSSASYALTVYKSDDGISWSASSCTVTYGDEETYSFPTLNNPGKQTITYSSSNKSVATIDDDGSVSVVAEGETTITASAEANDAYEAASVSYTLTVEGDLESAGLEWSEESFTATMGEDNDFPTLSNPNSLEVTYSSSDESVATVDSDGNITLVAAGTTSIIATSEADDTYAAGSASYSLKVVKQDVTLEWSESSFKATLEEDNSFPTLSVDPGSLSSSISYSSSNESVATIDGSGNVTLVATGSSTISASFEGDDTYKSAGATYTLTVVSGSDDGAGTYTYSSTGDSSSDDDISNTTFTRMITVTYSSSSASVSGDYYGYASVNGGHVTINNSNNDENIVYKLTGTTTDGSFTLYSSKKQAILLDGVSITNPDGAAINNQSGKRTFVMVEGSNYLYDSSSAAYSTSGDEDMKAVLFSEGQLVISGSGTLTVQAKNAQEKSCIASDDYVRIMDSPTLKITSGSSAGHGIRGKEYVQLSSGTLTISTSAAMKKGITSEDYVLVEGGTHTLTISGGVAYDSDDAEYKGSAGIKADNYFGMTGGTVTIKNTGKGGKGVRAGSYSYLEDNSVSSLTASYMTGGSLNITTSGSESNDVSCKAIKIGYKESSGSSYKYGGDMNISGGSIVINCSKSEGFEVKGALTISGGETYVYSTGDDAVNSQGAFKITGGYVYAYSTANDGLDSNSNFTLSGGYVFAITTAGGAEVAVDCAEGCTLSINSGVTLVAYPSLEQGASMSQTCYTMSCSAGSWNALHNGSSYIAAFKAPSGVSSVVVSAPSLSKGYTGVSVGSTTYCNGTWASSSISGGTATSLSTYSGGNSGGGGHGGGGGPGGGW